MPYLTVNGVDVYTSNIVNAPVGRSRESRILSDINLSVEPGEILGIVGPTGCGKTVLLKTIAGFITPSSGSVMIGGRDITLLKPYKRGMSMVFQDYALYPHLTSRRNVGFRLFMKKDPLIHPDARVEEIAALLGIDKDKILDRYPRSISIGEKQRVAIGKAIAALPDMVLFDEPLSNIDANLRNSLRHHLRKMLKDHNVPAVYVSHNQFEVAEVADRIAVMYNGRIEQVDTFNRLYSDPATFFVSLFIGEKTTNFIRAEEVTRLTGGRINYILTIRPEECVLAGTGNSIALAGKVALIENYITDRKKVVFIEHGQELFGVEVPITSDIQKGQEITIHIPLGKAKYFENSEGPTPLRVKGPIS